MPVCPSCKNEVSKRRLGRCIECNAKVDIYKGTWILSGSDSPPVQIVRHFEKLISEAITAETGQPSMYEIGEHRAAWRAEIALASQILEEYDNDVALVEEAMRNYFFNPAFHRGSYLPPSLAVIKKSLRMIVVFLKAKQANEDREKELERRTIERLQRRGAS